LQKTTSSSPAQPPARPPLYTLLCEVAGWTLDRTADIPKNARFTFGQRLDNLALDALQLLMSGGSDLPGRCQESSLTAAPAPVG
jgi:hypothetical protein